MEQEFRFWRFAHLWIAFFTIVVDQKLGQARQESNQVEQTLTVSLLYLRLGNIVPALRNSGMDALCVEIGTTQAHVPHPNLDFLCERALEQSSNCFSSKRGLERVVEPFVDSPLQQPLTFIPGSAICIR